ncbi:MAG TPA: hypothetical protein PLO20_12400 [Thermogutta sp.]|nr:hypothetical protein [Thermogutta sp.]
MPSFSVAPQGKVLPEIKVTRYLADSAGDRSSPGTAPLVVAPCYGYATEVYCTLCAYLSQPWRHWEYFHWASDHPKGLLHFRFSEVFRIITKDTY